MADRLDSERLRGFDFRRTDRQTGRQTDRWTDICDCRVAFATEKLKHKNVVCSSLHITWVPQTPRIERKG